MEKPHIASMRVKFLRRYTDNLAKDKKPVIFLDETWIFANGCFRRSWKDSSMKTVKRSVGEGSRYIVLHAGGEKGFVADASLIFKSKSKTGDYHGDMDADKFETWLVERLLPALEEPSIVVLDNASYHSRQLNKAPSSAVTKKEIQTWLTQNNIRYPESALKMKLLEKLGMRCCDCHPIIVFSTQLKWCGVK